MGSEPAIVEISSDDEEDFSLDKFDPFNWVADMLDRTDGRVEEVDDVVVVDELSSAPPAKQKKNSESLSPGRVAAGDESDDDCLMLDSDPSNPVSVVDKGDRGDGSDDLLIVGEKGQLACRDYPHPRHLCANFPFSTTSHERHCNLCHCYVCDSPAPCIYWGNGSASTDHCHSTDQDGRWKSQRQSFKQKNLMTSQPQKLPDMTLSMMPSFQNSAPLHCSNMSSLRIPTSRSNPLRPCSATRCATPDPPNQRHQQNTGPLSYSGQRLGHHSSKSHPLNPRTQCIQRQLRVSGSFTAQLVYSRTRFKRVGTAQAGPVSSRQNRSPCRVSNNNQFQRNVPQRSRFTTVASQRSQCPPMTLQRSQCPRVTSQKSQCPPVTPPQRSYSATVTSQVSHCPSVTSVDDNVNQVYITAPQRSQHVPVISQRSRCLPVTPPQRSYSAPVTSQISQCPSVTEVDDNVNQMYRAAPQSSEHVPVISQSSQCPPVTPVNDNMKSWLDILASVASELGVSDSNSRDAAPAVQEPLLVSSQTLPFSQFVSETNASQDVDRCGRSAPEVTNMNSLDFDCGWLKPAAQSIQENGQGVDPQLKNVRPSDTLVSGSKQDPGETRLGSFLASLEEIAAETAKEPGKPELNPVTLLYDFEATRSGLAPV